MPRFGCDNWYVYNLKIRSSKLLRNIDGCRGIFICPDRTVEERRTQKELIDQLKQKRLENPNARYHIRSGQIVLYNGTWALDEHMNILLSINFIIFIHPHTAGTILYGLSLLAVTRFGNPWYISRRLIKRLSW